MITNMKDVIEKMVRQEIRDILTQHKAFIEEAVGFLLIPELKAAVRESVCDALEALTEKPSPSPDLGLWTSDFGPTTPDPGPQSSDFGPRTLDFGPPKGRYLYCIADASENASLGNIGIEENAVYTIPYNDLSAIVHNCPARPYKSEDPEIVKGWVITHQEVVDAAWDRFGTVIPIGFDTIIQGDAALDPEETMKKWFKDDYDNLKAKMEKIRGRAEYGVQVLWDKRTAAQKIADDNPEIKNLSNEIQSKPRGLAYMYRQKLEGLLRKEMEKRADQYFREFYEKIIPHADDIRVEKTQKTENGEKQMLLNLSCLLPKEGSRELGEELEKIDALEDFSVRYTGPWPPYSFV